nr:uncharacterized protein LOC116776557 isoform X1 [Danaus plexippus plexippus]
MMLPRPQLSPGYRSPSDINNIPTGHFHFTRSPEPNLLPSLSKEHQTQQANTRSQQQVQKSYIDNELMLKLKKRAALIPESSDSSNELTTDHSIPTQRSNFKHQTQRFFKPPPHTPRDSEDSYGWVDNFNEIVPLEPINLYNM